MRYAALVAILAIAVLSYAQPVAAINPNSSRVRVVGGIKSSNTPTGPVIDGLGLSLTDRQFPMRNRNGYTWLALELRNVGCNLKWVFGFSSLSNVRATVTDQNGHVVPPYRYPKFDFDAPVSTNGVPIPVGKSIWLAIPINALVPLPKHGTYTVRLRTAGTMDVQTREPIDLISNPLTIRV